MILGGGAFISTCPVITALSISSPFVGHPQRTVTAKQVVKILGGRDLTFNSKNWELILPVTIGSVVAGGNLFFYNAPLVRHDPLSNSNAVSCDSI